MWIHNTGYKPSKTDRRFDTESQQPITAKNTIHMSQGAGRGVGTPHSLLHVSLINKKNHNIMIIYSFFPNMERDSAVADRMFTFLFLLTKKLPRPTLNCPIMDQVEKRRKRTVS
jgi:hypothetical protein